MSMEDDIDLEFGLASEVQKDEHVEEEQSKTNIQGMIYSWNKQLI